MALLKRIEGFILLNCKNWCNFVSVVPDLSDSGFGVSIDGATPDFSAR